MGPAPEFTRVRRCQLRDTVGVYAGVLLNLLVLVWGGHAHALSLRSAKIRIDPKRGDSFVLAGSSNGLSGDVTLALDRFRFMVPAKEFRKGKFNAGKGGSGLTLLKVSRDRFIAEGVGLALAGLPNPFPLQVGNDCELIRVRSKATRKAKHRSARTQLSLAGDAGPCRITSRPSLDPITVQATVQTDVTVRLSIPGNVDAESVKLFKVDNAGRPMGAPLCVLQDDGKASDGDQVAGDATFGCIVGFTEPHVTLLPLIVVASSAGQAFSSPGFVLAVVNPPAPSDIQIVLDVQNAAASFWSQSQSQFGDGLQARTRTIAFLGGQQGVLEAALSPDGVDIGIVYTSGIVGGLMLSPRIPAVSASTATMRLLAGPTAFLRLLDTQRGSLHTGFPESTAGCMTAPRHRVGNGNVLVFDPLFFPAGEDESITIPDMMQNACPNFSITPAYGSDATVGAILSLANYGTVLLTTHGFVDPFWRVNFLTGQETDSPPTDFRHLLTPPALTIVGPVPGSPYTKPVVAVAPSFMQYVPGQMPDGIVWAGYCWSAFSGGFGEFLTKGASTVFGFTSVVSSPFALSSGANLFQHLLDDFATANEAYESITPKVDPLGSFVFDPRTHLWAVPAHFDIYGDSTTAYLGPVSLVPGASTIMNGSEVALTAVVEGADSCTLRYHWRNSVPSLGTLTDGMGSDDFQSDMTSVNFTANANGLMGTTSVDVGVLSQDAMDTNLNTCGSVVVEGTTTTTTSSPATTTTTSPVVCTKPGQLCSLSQPACACRYSCDTGCGTLSCYELEAVGSQCDYSNPGSCPVGSFCVPSDRYNLTYTCDEECTHELLYPGCHCFLGECVRPCSIP